MVCFSEASKENPFGPLAIQRAPRVMDGTGGASVAWPVPRH